MIWEYESLVDWKVFKTVIAALILFEMARTNTLFTIGGAVVALIVYAVVISSPKHSHDS